MALCICMGMVGWWLHTRTHTYSYVRPRYTFNHMVSPTSREFPVEMGRYHIYVGNACPWCHRILLTLALRGLQPQHVSVSQVEDDPERASRGGVDI